MPTNLELKARIDSIDACKRRAADGGAAEDGVMNQVDTYFTTSSGRLKLRIIDGRQAELIGYTRDELSDERSSTYEKTLVPDPGTLRGILERTLGVRVVVNKHRDLYWYKSSRIHIDNVENLGTFIEFEVPTERGVDADEVMQELRTMFDIRAEDIVRVSYADLLLNSAHRNEVHPGS